ncbi:hypothetical protein DV517_27880 [Streptomyces sp. S816]|nr:hypothetical protein DV517_27880 [Streptomyces sp. S816]
MVSQWQFEVPTAGSKLLPPDGRYMEALSSQGYGFEAAIADLVDNSIDAGAANVVVHFLRDGEQLVSLVVVDDGKGMGEEELDVAMTVGGRRGYSERSLGMFGTGLKSASLSHADSVTVVSRTKRSRPAGRRWLMKHAKQGFECDIIDPDFAQQFIDFYQGRPIGFQGTIVRWDGVKDFPKHGGGGQTDRYLHRTVNKLGLHLGLHLHRFLAGEGFHITISVQDVRTGVEYANYGVEPLDPFAYPVSGDSDYPRAPLPSMSPTWDRSNFVPTYGPRVPLSTSTRHSGRYPKGQASTSTAMIDSFRPAAGTTSGSRNSTLLLPVLRWNFRTIRTAWSFD